MDWFRPMYLLRFDDICPTMNWSVWDRVETILAREEIRPILAVVPDNQDSVLEVSAPCPEFWSRVRDWQRRGWTIGMHGYQHRFVTSDSGILRVNRYSEFAGLSHAEQEAKLRAGVSILHSQNVRSTLWVAPAHSFDQTTLRLLLDVGFECISDGYSAFPYIDRFGLTWLPQQLWSFRRRPFGVWTICFHVNKWADGDLAAFRRGVARFREDISSVDRVLGSHGGRQHGIMDTIWARGYRFAVAASAPIRRFRTHPGMQCWRERPMPAQDVEI